ncbi:MAG: hypothetical protein OWT28_06100, partial [Firmicutes bacterium]|nr:hypothetical protein [Bacillota bacterium]
MKPLILYLILSLIATVAVVGCGAPAQPSVDLTGAILGWDNRLYKLETVVGPQQVGKQLALVGYHGRISNSFVIRQLVGSNPDRYVIFEAYGLDGKPDALYYKAVVTEQ